MWNFFVVPFTLNLFCTQMKCDKDVGMLKCWNHDIIHVTGVYVEFHSIENSSSYWGNYTDWSECSATCGHGTRERTRQCIGSSDGGADEGCIGDDTETEVCSTPTGKLTACIPRLNSLWRHHILISRLLPSSSKRLCMHAAAVSTYVHGSEGGANDSMSGRDQVTAAEYLYINIRHAQLQTARHGATTRRGASVCWLARLAFSGEHVNASSQAVGTALPAWVQRTTLNTVPMKVRL